MTSAPEVGNFVKFVGLDGRTYVGVVRSVDENTRTVVIDHVIDQCQDAPATPKQRRIKVYRKNLVDKKIEVGET